MPVPNCSFKAKMLIVAKMICKYTKCTYPKENSTNNYMETMNSCCHIKHRAKNTIRYTKTCVSIFKNLNIRK